MQLLALQTILKSKGFDPGSLDGKPGAKTLAAIKAFQTANGLQADGVVGPKTLTVLGAAPGAALGLAATPSTPAAGPGGDEPAWLKIARTYIGTCEIGGPKHNAVILQWWRDIKNPWFKDDETPWCAAFVGGMLEAAGIACSYSAAARSYESWGQLVSGPQVGAVVVFTRTGGGHVGFVVGRDISGGLMVLGGNQSNKVGIAAFNPKRVVAYRWPGGMPVPNAPLPVLESDGTFSLNEA